jgi:hypothetical protein
MSLKVPKEYHRSFTLIVDGKLVDAYPTLKEARGEVNRQALEQAKKLPYDDAPYYKIYQEHLDRPIEVIQEGYIG